MSKATEIRVTLGCDALQVKFPVYIWKYLGKPGRCVPSMFNAKILGYPLKHYDHESGRDAWVGILMMSFPVSVTLVKLLHFLELLLYLHDKNTLKNSCKDDTRISIMRCRWRLDVQISKVEKLPLCTLASLSNGCECVHTLVQVLISSVCPQ